VWLKIFIYTANLCFEDNLEDSSGTNQDGVWDTVLGSFVEGYQGKAADITSASFSIPHNSVFGNLDKLTLKVWAKSNEVASSPSPTNLIRKTNSFILRAGPNGNFAFISFYIYINGTAYSLANWQIAAGTGLSQWHLYSATYDGEHVRIFFDNEMVGELDATGTVDGNTNVVQIGTFDGALDNVYISNDIEDIDKPVFYDFSPQPGQTWVDENSAVTVRVADTGRGVDPSSIIMTVGGVAVNPQISGDSSDYLLTWVPSTSFAYGQTVPVSLSAADNAGNTEQIIYSFTVKDQTDTRPPIATLYAYRDDPLTVVVHSALSDNEDGVVPNAQMRFSTDGITWSDPEDYASIKELEIDESVSSIYARFSDTCGNWTEPLSFALDGSSNQLIALNASWY